MSPCPRALNSAITWHWKASGAFAQAAALCKPPWDGNAGGCQALGADKAQKSSPSPKLSGTQQISGEGLLLPFFFLTPKTFCFGLQLINNVVIVPVKRLSHIYTCIHSPPNPREGLLNGGELGALRTAWIWADFILIGFSPRNKIDNAKQRENGKTRKISDAEQALSRPGISRFVSGKGQIVNIFGSLKTATATKKVNGHGCVSVKLNLQKTGGGLYLAPGQSPHAGPRVTLSAGTLGSLSCVIHLLTALAWVPLCRCEGSIPAWLLTARAGEAGLSRSYPPSHHPPPPPHWHSSGPWQPWGPPTTQWGNARDPCPQSPAQPPPAHPG